MMNISLKSRHQTLGKITIKQIIQSVIASAFGVQKQKNHERDFSEGRPANYIIAGLVATVLFIFLLVGVVQLVINLHTT